MKKLLLILSSLFLFTSFLYASDYTVSGATSPAAVNGDYTNAGTYNGQPYYKHNTENYWIVYGELSSWWEIRTTYDDDMTVQFVKADPITGTYSNVPPNEGTVVVSVASASEFTVTFSEQNSIDDVSIAVYTDEARTNEHDDSPITTAGGGTATIDVENGTYYYTASKVGYQNNLGDVTVSDTDIEEQFTMSASTRKKMLGQIIWLLGE